MKKKFLTKFLIFVIALLILSSPAFAKISDTNAKHNFSSKSWASNTDQQICVFCHSPHNATTGMLAPLWNHATKSVSYTPYSSPTLKSTTVSQQPAGASKLCLSCHDGTVAIDSFGQATGSNMVSGNALVGTDLSNDHPISLTYDSDLAGKANLNDPATTIPALGGKTIQDGMLFGSSGSKYSLECASCHDVHETRGESASSGGHLLVVNNKGSKLCLTCHKK